MENIGTQSKRFLSLRFLTSFLIAAAWSLTIREASSVTLAWDPNPEPDIAGYILHYGTSSGSYSNSVNVGNVTTNTVAGLAVNVTYFFAVTAYNASGLESDFSNEVSYTVDLVPPTVSIKSPLAGARLTNGTVTLQGTASDNKGVAQVLVQLGTGLFQPATGTTNWSATLALVPGPNTVRVKSVDAAGNESLPVSETITYVVWSPFTVGTNGNGSVVPNLNGQLLEIAKLYTLSAVPGLGFVFTNWTSGIATNGAVLTFAMRSNLVLTANFNDVMKPVVAITSPLANARLTNGTVTVQGTASDNKGVARVLYQLGAGPFQVATGTTSWSATLALVPGPNTVRVKSVDATGNESLPVSETITYVVWSPFTVGTNGNGSVVPNLNGQLLEIAKLYTLSAVPGLGFVFTNWTSGIATNGAVLTFAMRSNLVLTANFNDVMKPVVAITSPLANARLTNGTVTVQGTASDNKGVARVLYQLGAGPFQVATGTTSWSATLALAPGPNTVRVKSVDAAGNESLPVSETITYVVLSQLTVGMSGKGTVSPDLNGHLLEVGQPYTLTAVPGVGFLFSNWVGGFSAETARLAFTMQPNLALTAQFVANPFLTAQGNYHGLFYETNGVLHESSGFFSLTLANQGAFSGFLITAGLTTPFAGQFSVAGKAQVAVARAGKSPLNLSLQIQSTNGIPQIDGSVSDGVWMAELLADPAWSDLTDHPYYGAYTLMIPGQPDATYEPAGFGHATVTVDWAGNILLQGKLADGEIITQSVPISKNREWPLYVSLYGGKGSILSWITFTNRSSDNLAGPLSWIKPSLPGAVYYPGGFTNEAMVSGTLYTPPTTNRLLNFSAGQVVFSGGGLSQPLTNSVTLDPLNRVINLTGNPMTFTISLVNGTFTGTFRSPASAPTRTFEGVLLPLQNAGYGFFLGTNQSGQVRLEAAP